jgi:hypothetical protein
VIKNDSSIKPSAVKDPLFRKLLTSLVPHQAREFNSNKVVNSLNFKGNKVKSLVREALIQSDTVGMEALMKDLHSKRLADK